VVADAAFTATGESFETGDSVSQPTPTSALFSMAMLRSGTDTVRLDLSGVGEVCLRMTTNTGGLPVYWGVNAEAKPALAQIDVLTGEACGVTQPDASCGMPAIAPREEAGAFVWQDCPGGVPTGRWHLRLTAGGDAVVRYDGTLTTDGAMTNVVPYRLESTDVLSGDASQQTFLMRMFGVGVDGADLSLGGASELCLGFSGTSAGPTIYRGADKVSGTGPMNVIDGGACH
jgi:hypothetical protein